MAQLVVIPFYGETPHPRSRKYRDFVRLVNKERVGGMILVNRVKNGVVRRAEPHAVAAFTNRMQKLAEIPLIVAGDFERGASMRVNGATLFPHAMAFGATGDPRYTRYLGAVTARESRAMGVHWVLYPVADVNNNPDNPIINIRSFGENVDEVSRHVEAFIEGAHSDPRVRVLTAVKHFPGHGDTTVDTHFAMATVTGAKQRLESVELPPFRAAIAANVDAVMSAHLAVPALDSAETPATLSRAVLTDLLRDDLGFRGLVVTDALDMGGVAKGFSNSDAAVRAIEAGADVLMMPPDPVGAIDAVVAAVQKGRISRHRLDASVKRVLAAKERLGLHRKRLVDVEAVSEVMDDPEAAERAQEIADRAVTLVRNNNEMLPLPGIGQTCYVVMSGATQGQTLLQEIQSRTPQGYIMQIDSSVSEAQLNDTVLRAAACDRIVISTFVAAGSYHALGMQPKYARFLESLIATGKPVLLVSLGNPYLLRHYPNVAAYMTTFSTVQPAETAVAKALFGEIPIQGKLPVSIPGFASSGYGIELPARVQ